MSHTRANLLLISIAIAWGSSYIFMKVGLESLNTSSIIVWRFALAFIVMAALFYKKIIRVTKQTLVASAILALPMYGVFVFLLNGMQSTTVSTASFLTSTTVVFVPLLHALITKHIPSRKTMMSLAVVVAGLALLTIGDDFGLSYGAILCLLCAICNALYLVWTNHYAKKVQPLQLGIFQLGFTALYGCVGFAVEAPMMPATMNEWMAILGMALLCSAYGYVLQPVASGFYFLIRTCIRSYFCLYGFWRSDDGCSSCWCSTYFKWCAHRKLCTENKCVYEKGTSLNTKEAGTYV